jgi:hypothetical protein
MDRLITVAPQFSPTIHQMAPNPGCGDFVKLRFIAGAAVI